MVYHSVVVRPGSSCKIFKKKYKYVKPPKPYQRPKIILYNDDNLFDDIPEAWIQAHQETQTVQNPELGKVGGRSRLPVAEEEHATTSV